MMNANLYSDYARNLNVRRWSALPKNAKHIVLFNDRVYKTVARTAILTRRSSSLSDTNSVIQHGYIIVI